MNIETKAEAEYIIDLKKIGLLKINRRLLIFLEMEQ